MIPVVDRGTSFYGILNYAISKDGARMIGSRQGEVYDLAHEFKKIADVNDRVVEPVLHLMINLPVDEHLSDPQWSYVAWQMMSQLGYNQNPYVVIRHTDEPHEHIHIIGSRVRWDGRVPDDYREKKRACDIADRLEDQFGLKKAALGIQKGAYNYKKGEEELYKRTGRASHKQMVYYRVKVALANSRNVPTFLKNLEAYHVGVKVNIAKEHVSGISLELDGKVFKGSKIGYSWSKLAKALNYTVADNQALREARASIPGPPYGVSGDALTTLRLGLRDELLAEAKRGRGYLSIAALLGHSARRLSVRRRKVSLTLELEPDELEEERELEAKRKRKGRTV